MEWNVNVNHCTALRLLRRTRSLSRHRFILYNMTSSLCLFLLLIGMIWFDMEGYDMISKLFAFVACELDVH